MIDTKMGSGPMASAGKDSQYGEIIMKVTDSTFYGESEIPDCPHKDDDYCFYYDKSAIFPGSVVLKAKKPHETSKSALPLWKVMSDVAWTGVNHIERNTFIGFKSRTHMDRKMSIYALNPSQSDYQPMVIAKDNKFVDVEDDSLFYFSSPSPGWANLKDCGDFPCTAPHNVLFSHTGSKWEGKKPATMGTLTDF